MRKLLLVVPALALVAAGCSNSEPTTAIPPRLVNPPERQTQTLQPNTVDAALDEYIGTLEMETQDATRQSDQLIPTTNITPTINPDNVQ